MVCGSPACYDEKGATMCRGEAHRRYGAQHGRWKPVASRDAGDRRGEMPACGRAPRRTVRRQVSMRLSQTSPSVKGRQAYRRGKDRRPAVQSQAAGRWAMLRKTNHGGEGREKGGRGPAPLGTKPDSPHPTLMRRNASARPRPCSLVAREPGRLMRYPDSLLSRVFYPLQRAPQISRYLTHQGRTERLSEPRRPPKPKVMGDFS